MPYLKERCVVGLKVRVTAPFAVILLLIVCFPTLSRGAIGGWHWRNPYPQGNRLWDVCFGNGTFVAVGDNALLTSTNGELWTHRRLPFPQVLMGVTFGNGVFVAVGWNGTILTSSNAADWVSRNSGVSHAINKVVFGDGKFVAVTEASTPTILVSEDATHWSSVPESNWGLTDVAFGNGTFVAIGGSWVQSLDGTNWTEHGSLILGGITFGNGLFVACGNLGFVYTSYDGVRFQSHFSGSEEFKGAIGYSAGMFVAAGGLGAVAVSTNGTNWTAGSTGFADAIEGIAYGNGRWVVVGDNGRILVSSNAVDWTTANRGIRAGLADITGDEHLMVAVGEEILTSPDGVAWTRRDPRPVDWLGGVCRGSSHFVAVGGLGQICVSQDGIMWTNLMRPMDSTLTSVTFGNNTYVAVGREGVVLVSSNALDWTQQISGTSANLLRVTHANSLFVAVGAQASIITSSNGLTWSTRDPGLSGSEAFTGVAWGNGRFVAVGYNENWLASSPMLTSPDGIAWTSHGHSIEWQGFSDVAFGNGMFVVPAATPAVLTSIDGIDWDGKGAGAADFSRVAYINGRFVGVGPNGAILQSDPINRLQMRSPGKLRLFGPSGATNRVQISTNMFDWFPLQTVVNLTGAVDSIDFETNAPRRFYRVIPE